MPEEDARRGQSKRNQGLRRMLLPARSQISVALCLGLVGFAIMAQVGIREGQDPYASMRRDDLIALLDTLTDETERLNNEVAELENTRDALRSGADAQQIAEAEAQRRRDSIEILSGAVAASGPGIRVTISAPAGAISADLMLDAIEELRDAGAEVIEINDSIRLAAQSWVQTRGDMLIIDGVQVSLPITIDAIGDSHSLAEGTRFRGGLVSQIEADSVGGSVTVEESEQITITALRLPQKNQFARPA